MYFWARICQKSLWLVCSTSSSRRGLPIWYVASCKIHMALLKGIPAGMYRVLIPFRPGLSLLGFLWHCLCNLPKHKLNSFLIINYFNPGTCAIFIQRDFAVKYCLIFLFYKVSKAVLQKTNVTYYKITYFYFPLTGSTPEYT